MRTMTFVMTAPPSLTASERRRRSSFNGEIGNHEAVHVAESEVKASELAADLRERVFDRRASARGAFARS